MKYFLCFYFLLLSISSHGQTTATLPKEVVKSIEKRIKLGLNPSIVIGIIDKDGTHFFNFGKKSDYGSAADEHTIYEIGSITKTFTAILLAQQAIDGKLKIDDPIKNYLPSQVKVPQRGTKEITFGNLSDHTSGLPREPDNLSFSSNPKANYSVDSMYSFLSRCELKRDVGSAYEYSNLAHGLLGEILSLNRGITYEVLMIQTIATPLGMKETKITFDEEMKKNMAIGYSYGFEVENWHTRYAMSGCGGIRSSTYDMLKFLAANMGLTPTPLQSAMNKTHEVRHNKSEAAGWAYGLSNMRIGLGWEICNGKKGDVILHDGGAPGYLAFAGFVKEIGKGVVVLTNSRQGDISDIGLHLLDPGFKLWPVKPNIALELKKIIDENGVEASKNHFYDFKKSKPDKCESIINELGYSYMKNNINTALALLKMNVEMYPNSFNVYDSYGEALLKNGQQDLAIENYKKSVELNPRNMAGIQALEKMGVKIQVENVEVPEVTLETYVGTYQLNRGFNLVITREGKQLFAQATGQEKFELFPKNTKEFFTDFKAELIFNSKGKNRTVESLTNVQNGKKYNFKKIK
jgi:serine-type D-Ala-D-Ala carboxypeptidase/endopeptidase